MKIAFIWFIVLIADVASARPVCNNGPGGAQPQAGQEIPVYDGCGVEVDFEIPVSTAEGYKAGAIDKAAMDLAGLLVKYMPKGDPTLKYHKAVFTPANATSGRLTVWGEKKWGPFWSDFSAYGVISVSPIMCEGGYVKGYSILFVPDPKFVPKLEDAFRRANISFCFVESAAGLKVRVTARMVAGAGFKYWVSHVAHGLLAPIISRLKPRILELSQGNF
ncbi:MAG: hypothetical protein ABL958_02920 [Bdellovibrionia bacterium]